MKVCCMMQRLISRVENLSLTVYLSFMMFAKKSLREYRRFVNQLIQVTNITIAEELQSPWLIQKYKINIRRRMLAWSHSVSSFIILENFKFLTKSIAKAKDVISTVEEKKLTP